MPGRLRTASRPSSTWISEPPYSCSTWVGLCSNVSAMEKPPIGNVGRAAKGRPREGPAGAAFGGPVFRSDYSKLLPSARRSRVAGESWDR